MTLDTKHQAPGKAKEDSAGINNWLIHPILVSPTPSLSLSLCGALYLPLVPYSVPLRLHSPPVPKYRL